MTARFFSESVAELTAVSKRKGTPSPLTPTRPSPGKNNHEGRTRSRIGVPGAWHSQLSYPLQSANRARILTAAGFDGIGNLESPTLRTPPRSREGGC